MPTYSPRFIKCMKGIKWGMTPALAILGGVTLLLELGNFWLACLFCAALLVYVIAEFILLFNALPNTKDD